MYFTLSQTQYLILSIFGGLLLVAILIIAFWSFRLSLARRRAAGKAESYTGADEDVLDFSDGIRESKRPMPLFVILLVAAILIWGVAYVLAVALGVLNVQ